MQTALAVKTSQEGFLTECPPCQALVSTPCLGGHTAKPLPCCQATPFSCSSACGQPLQCGNHTCSKACHALTGEGSTLIEFWPMNKLACALCISIIMLGRAWGMMVLQACHTAAPHSLGRKRRQYQALLCQSVPHLLLSMSALLVAGERSEPCRQCSLPCQRARGCEHACPLPCHPGPCPACTQEKQEACNCGRSLLPLQCHHLQQVRLQLLCKASNLLVIEHCFGCCIRSAVKLGKFALSLRPALIILAP